MNTKPKLKVIVANHRDLWDHTGTRPVVRSTFQKLLDCGTRALGAAVYKSPSGEMLIVPYTCKSRGCSSCGQRSTLGWQKAIDCDLPDIPYVGVTFTMPDVFWEIFRENRGLLDALPAIAAGALQDWADRKYRAAVLIVTVVHTFGSRLNFNPHVHLIASKLGLDRSEGKLVKVLYYKDALMQAWRNGLLNYLIAALDRGLLGSTKPHSELRALFLAHYGYWWNSDIRECSAKGALVRYISRYLRRPPIAGHNILACAEGRISIRGKDTRQNRPEIIDCSVNEFLLRLADQVPDRCRHGVHYFGLLAPRCKARAYEVFLAFMGKKRRPRPPRTRWRVLIHQTFQRDPLRTANGEIMQKVGWLAPNKPKTTVEVIPRR